MALSCTFPTVPSSSECKELLLELITAINELRSHIRFQGDSSEAQNATDGTFHLGCPPDKLEQLHRSIKRIFTHGIKVFNDENIPDVWKVIEGLKFSNPAISLRVKRSEIGSVSMDKGLLWIFQCIQQRCVSENINWLITDKEHMGQCYERTAFLRDEKYADAMMVCLNALERGQLALLSQIDPSLYAQNQLLGTIKRSESHPNLLLVMTTPSTLQEKGAVKRRQTIHLTKSHFASETLLKKRKISRSLPNIALRDFYHVIKKKPPDLLEKKMHSEYCGPSVPNFQYSDKSVPKPAPSILNCENIKIYTESCSSSSQSQGCWKKLRTEKHMDPNSRTDLFSLASLGSPRVLLNDFIPQCGEKIHKTSESKTICSVLNDLPSRPVPGQSLTSFLKTVYFSRTNTELDRENAHFSLSEALIATFEQLKWNEEETSNGRRQLRKRSSSSNFWSPHPGLPQFLSVGPKPSDELQDSVSPSTASKESSSTVASSLSDSNSSGSCDSNSLLGKTHVSRQLSDEDLEAIEASECDNVKSYSAEGVALSLLSKFNEKQLPTACDLLWLVSEQDAPQQILPIPPDGQIVNPDEQSGLNTIIRGTREWAPPRPQIIFTYTNPLPDRRAQMTKQNFRCAGCGMKVAPAYSSRFRYCHYLGKYNCSMCHKNQMSAIPAKVIERWDFTFHPVSSFSYHLLNDIAGCPLYRINHLNPKLYEKVRILQVARSIRKSLTYIRDFIVNCRFAEDVTLLFRTIPDHLTADLDSWSMTDFISVRNGMFQKEKMDFIRRCEKHIFECELCLAHGFFCENCDRKEVIFPWQKRIVKCSKCGACFHEACWLPDCVKCNRLLRRRLPKK
ncbi:run domain Beclin-1-interacting and cysteine-rich domain-containing protein isoform X2 [Topomyia yanbarensis]|uniref:run domain Beclin-1-interacting and cysteine-rich domain-containing protein isoform X2 n=1 Tax=Topomyia yanbarensis TaxID=2498891 RepID=UPI00273AEA7B|nr:run domain Beclin-1-interacting and cysteine-rich domain-containing protein isoform X2 [Topomyia yanbarensis]